MKKGLLGSTALIGATALMAGAAGAAEAPTWKLTGNMNFQVYYVDQDNDVWQTTAGSSTVTAIWAGPLNPIPNTYYSQNVQDHGWYFGVDEAELQLNVSGTADNGLNYGFKIEVNANTDDGTVADEARLQLSGGWGTLQMGDEDGAEDIMNYGGETIMGATGGFDGDFGDALLRFATFAGGPTALLAPSAPTIDGDTSDATKISYFSPRFSGFQVGASLTPTPNSGDCDCVDGAWENHIGVGANYDNSFGGVRVRASAVYSGASSNNTSVEDVSAWSVGGVVGFGPASISANYTDNGDSGRVSGDETSYWNVAGSFETGPLYFSAGYMSGTHEVGVSESTMETISVTADYSVAPGLGAYAEIDLISDELPDNIGFIPGHKNDATIFIAGMNVSF